MIGRNVSVGDEVLVKLGFWPFGVTARVQILGDKKRHWKRRLFRRGGRISQIETYRAYILYDNEEGLHRDKARFINIREGEIVEIVEKKKARLQDKGDIIYLERATTGAA